MIIQPYFLCSQLIHDSIGQVNDITYVREEMSSDVQILAPFQDGPAVMGISLILPFW